MSNLSWYDNSAHYSNDENDDNSTTMMDQVEEEEVMSHAQLKELGNASYKAGDYDLAIEHYSRAIESAVKTNNDKSGGTNQENSTLQVAHKQALASTFNNRAAAYAMRRNPILALNDCQNAINVDPTFVKAYIRMGKTQTQLGLLDDAFKTYSLALARVDAMDDTLLKERETVKVLKQRLELAHRLLQPEHSPNNKSSSATTVSCQNTLECLNLTCNSNDAGQALLRR